MTPLPQTPLHARFDASSTSEEVMTGVDLHGATAVVTGGYSGLGRETTRALAAAGARVIVPARRPDLARDRLSGVANVIVIPMDLADLASVHTAGEQLVASETRVDILIAAAGVMASPERRVGPGWESQFAINHLGHFVLVDRLLPLLSNAEGARVVSYSSAGHHLSDIRWDDLHLNGDGNTGDANTGEDNTGGYNKWLAYGQSKTANALFAAHLDVVAQNRGIRAFSLHPGSIFTELQRDVDPAEAIELGWTDTAGNIVAPGLKTPSQGAATGLWAATSPALDDHGGVYCENCDVAPIAGPDGSMDDGGVRAYAVDPASAERLWHVSAQITETGRP